MRRKMVYALALKLSKTEWSRSALVPLGRYKNTVNYWRHPCGVTAWIVNVRVSRGNRLPVVIALFLLKPNLSLASKYGPLFFWESIQFTSVMGSSRSGSSEGLFQSSLGYGVWCQGFIFRCMLFYGTELQQAIFLWQGGSFGEASSLIQNSWPFTIRVSSCGFAVYGMWCKWAAVFKVRSKLWFENIAH
jgi:hypothetical protein